MSDRAVRKQTVFRYIFPAFACALGIILGIRATSVPSLESVVKPALALLLVTTGLGILFPLAAFVPKVPTPTTERARLSTLAAGQIFMGLGQVIADARIRLPTLAFAALLCAAAALRVPGAFFSRRG